MSRYDGLVAYVPPKNGVFEVATTTAVPPYKPPLSIWMSEKLILKEFAFLEFNIYETKLILIHIFNILKQTLKCLDYNKFLRFYFYFINDRHIYHYLVPQNIDRYMHIDGNK